MPAFSIVMATFNGAEFLQAQLASLARQTLAPVELIISDDHSTDETLEIAYAFAIEAPFPVRIHKNETRFGYRTNFMRAVTLCQGELIAFCDQDDIWMPDKLQKCAEAFEKPGTMLVFHNGEVIDSKERLLRTLNRRAYYKQVNPPNSIDPLAFSLGFTQTFHHSLLKYVPLWPRTIDHNNLTEPMAHDQFFFFMASVLGNIIYLEDALVSYRQHQSNVFGDAVPQKMNMLQYFAWDRIPDFYAYASAANNRSQILKEGQKLEDGKSGLFDDGILRFTDLENRYRLRIAAHREPRIWKRGKAFSKLHLSSRCPTGREDLKGARNVLYDGLGGVARAGALLRGLKPIKVAAGSLFGQFK